MRKKSIQATAFFFFVIFAISCENKKEISLNNEVKVEARGSNVVSDVLLYSSKLAVFDENGDFLEKPRTSTKIISLDNNARHFSCYEAETIHKVEIIGRAEDLRLFKNGKIIREKFNVDESFSISYATLNGSSSYQEALYTIKSKDSTLYSFTIWYDGCH